MKNMKALAFCFKNTTGAILHDKEKPRNCIGKNTLVDIPTKGGGLG